MLIQGKSRPVPIAQTEILQSEKLLSSYYLQN